eukprot:scaffold14643_cov113-Isochrysis_galbana.AAC.3
MLRPYVPPASRLRAPFFSVACPGVLGCVRGPCTCCCVLLPRTTHQNTDLIARFPRALELRTEPTTSHPDLLALLVLLARAS